MSQELVPHEIVVGNILWGKAHFLTLHLPPEWDLAPGVGHPEIVASHERQNRRWVASGDAWYVLYNPQRRWAMELHLVARPRRTRNEAVVPSLLVAGHPAAVRRESRRRGLWRRWDVTYVTVTFECPATDRQVKLEFSGRCEQAAFEEILRFVPAFRCHDEEEKGEF